MVQQVAALQHVTPAILIMWANKSALEENVSGQKIQRAAESEVQQATAGFLMQGGTSDQPVLLSGPEHRSRLSLCSRQQVCTMLAD